MTSDTEYHPDSQYVPVENLTEGLASLIQGLLPAGGAGSETLGADFHNHMCEKISWYQDMMQDLTDHQLAVLELAVAGYHGKDIAEKMGISLKTVDAHCLAIKGELEAKLTNEKV